MALGQVAHTFIQLGPETSSDGQCTASLGTNCYTTYYKEKMFFLISSGNLNYSQLMSVVTCLHTMYHCEDLGVSS